MRGHAKWEKQARWVTSVPLSPPQHQHSALLSSALQGTTLIKAAKAESLIRKVLQHTPPGIFQHMMRTIQSQVRPLPRRPCTARGRGARMLLAHLARACSLRVHTPA